MISLRKSQTITAADARSARVIIPEVGACIVTDVTPLAPVAPGRVVLTYRHPTGTLFGLIRRADAVLQRAYGDWTV